MTASVAAPVIDGLPADQHDYGMSRGHSPVAEKVAAIDFDGTIVPWGPLMGDKDPEPGAVEALRAIKAAGYRIVIFTSRLSKRWARSVVGDEPWRVTVFLNEQEEYVRSTLTRHDIPFDEITAEKVPAEFYIDDKAFRYESGDWRTVHRTALSVSKGSLFWVRLTRRGKRVHRVVAVKRLRRKTEPNVYYRNAYVYDENGEDAVNFEFACGDAEAFYLWGERKGMATDDVVALSKSIAKNGGEGLVTSWLQPACFHCAKSKKGLE